jgi:DNA helicase HerA-like ATPase
MIRHALKNGIRVVCIDLTSQYQGRLADLNPMDLSITHELAEELGQKLFDVDTGTYGAGTEKKALGQFADTLRQQIAESVVDFLEGANSGLGLIRLEEISNTKATLWITELYMTCLLKYAREKLGACPRTLIVVEEAHTVMPEPSMMGLGDFDSRGLVGKIAQIALQGRKFGVGLLVLAQRTATVSKTVLTQCNTIISFTCYDDTSLGFLRNIFGPDHVALIPNLRPLTAVAFGPWIRSEKPIVFEIPFNHEKTAPESVQRMSKGGA